MSVLFFPAQLLLLIVGVLFMIPIGYQLLLTVAAYFARSVTRIMQTMPTTHFAILVPAHDEEQLLPTLLKSLAGMDYPKDQYTVYVVADNCTDRTAAVARQFGAIAYERHDELRRGKGYALQWLWDQLMTTQVPCDAAVILDADTVVSRSFLSTMDSALVQGANVVQAYYTVHNPERAWAMRLRAAALALVHYVRPKGRMVIGGSVGLKGNGMVFRRSILEQYRWSGSVTEDIDYHMALVLAGEQVVFAEDAVIWAEMPGTLAGAHTQNVRWEQGRLQLARQYVPQLLAGALTALRKGDWRGVILRLDSVMEHLIPPFSILLSASFAYLLCAFAVQSTSAIRIALILLVGQLAYLFAGLLLAKTPWQTYLALRYVPAFILWKLWLYVRILLRLENQGWVRTAR